MRVLLSLFARKCLQLLQVPFQLLAQGARRTNEVC
jgi:hypothetical protein